MFVCIPPSPQGHLSRVADHQHKQPGQIRIPEQPLRSLCSLCPCIFSDMEPHLLALTPNHTACTASCWSNSELTQIRVIMICRALWEVKCHPLPSNILPQAFQGSRDRFAWCKRGASDVNTYLIFVVTDSYLDLKDLRACLASSICALLLIVMFDGAGLSALILSTRN